MMAEISEYLNSITVDEPETYILTEIDSDIPMTESEIRALYAELTADSTDWNYTVETSGDQLRLYATRCNPETVDDFDAVWEATPSHYTDWMMVTRDYGYTVIAEHVS
jgi:hypothetical protein